MKKHFRPFFISAALFEGFRFKCASKITCVPAGPIDNDTPEIAIMLEEQVYPILANSYIEMRLEFGQMRFLIVLLYLALVRI